MERKVVLFGILFKLCLLLSVYVNSENSVNGHMEFKYDFRRHYRSVAFMCLRRNHDCYFYNITGQERHDVHDQMQIFTIEDRSVAFMCLKKTHDCYFYNMTGQERQDVHDQMKIFTIENKILTLVNTAGVFIRGPTTLYDHDQIYFRGFCRKRTMWLMK